MFLQLAAILALEGPSEAHEDWIDANDARSVDFSFCMRAAK